MKKLIIIFLFVIAGLTSVGQTNTGKQFIPWLRSNSITIPGPGDVTQPGYFIWHGDTIDFKIFADSTIVFEADSTVLFVTLKQLSDSLNSLPGGHDPATIGTAGTTAGLSIAAGTQAINMQSATAARNGYLTSGDFSNFFNKLTTVAHDNTLSGLGTVAFPLSADTTIMAAKIWVLAQNYIKENQLHWDSITNKPTIPRIEDIAYGVTWDGDTDGASKNTIYDKIESLAGGHAAVTLGDTALTGGLKLYGQELEFQPATASLNGYLTSTDWQTFNAYKTDSAGILRWTDTLNTRKGIATPYDLTTGLATKEPTLTKGNLTENVTGLQFSATRQVIGGAAELQITSGYSIPTTAQLTRAGNHVTNDADTLLNNEKSYKFLVGTVTGNNINVTLPEYTVSNYDILTVLPDSDITGADSITLSVNAGTQNKIFELTSIDSDYAYNLVYYNSDWYFWLGRMGEESSLAGDNTGDQTIDTFRIASNNLEISLSQDGVAKKTVSLSPYLDNTDAQSLTYAAYSDKGIMNISGGTGDTIPTVTSVNAGLMLPADKNKLDSASYFLESHSVYTVEYGALYNWWAATDARKITSSADWVVPTFNWGSGQWETLATYLGGLSVAGGKTKESGTNYWDSPNTGANNSSGFNGRGTGIRNAVTGVFATKNKECFFWATYPPANNTVPATILKYNDSDLQVYGSANLQQGSSIRLLYTGAGTPTSYTGNDGKIYPVVLIGSQYWIACNLNETKYRNGDWITGFDGGVYTPISNANWVAKTTEAMCYYNDLESNGGTLTGGIVEINFGDTINISDYETDPIYAADSTAIKDTLSAHNTRLLAVEGMDTTGIYHANRALLDAIDASDTTRWGTLQDLSGLLLKEDFTDSIANHYLTELDSAGFRITENQISDLQNYLTTEVDGSTTNEIQDLSLAGNTLSLSGDGTSVDLAPYANSANTVLSTSAFGTARSILISDGTARNAQSQGVGATIDASNNLSLYGTITNNGGYRIQSALTNSGFDWYPNGSGGFRFYSPGAGDFVVDLNGASTPFFKVFDTSGAIQMYYIGATGGGGGSGNRLVSADVNGYITATITNNSTNWNTAYSNRIATFTTTGNSGAATFSGNTLNIPNYTLAGLGGIGLTSLSSTATGLTYTNTTGVFSLTSGYEIPTTSLLSNIHASGSDNQTLTIGGTTSPTIALSGSNTATFAAGAGMSLNQTGGTITVTNNSLNTDAQTLSKDSTATTVGISISGGNRIAFNRGTSGGGINSYKVLSGAVVDRNIDVTLASYTPANGDIISVIPDSDIGIGDTITFSVNGGTAKNILDYTSHDSQYSLELVYLTDYWGLLGRKAEEYTVKGNNTGDQDLTGIRDTLQINLDSLDVHNDRLIAVEGLDTLGIYHTNRALLNTIDATDTTRWATDYNNISVPTTDGLATGNLIDDFNCGYSSSAIGDLVYLDSNATWQKADKGTSVATYSGFLGIALEVKASGNALKVAINGSFVYATAFPALTIGSPVYMGDNGAIVVTMPTEADHAIRVLGWAVHADKIWFQPSPDYLIYQ